MSGIRTIRKLKSWLENKDNDVKIGWYSEKQRNCNYRIRYSNGKDRPDPSANIYLTPEGKEVVVTEVTDSLVMTSTWDDMNMIGPVSKWVRSIYNMHITFPDYYIDIKTHVNIESVKEDSKEKQLERMFPSYKPWQNLINKEDEHTKI
jgi:hypothetical protein